MFYFFQIVKSAAEGEGQPNQRWNECSDQGDNQK